MTENVNQQLLDCAADDVSIAKANGIAAGEEWAQKWATPDELSRLEVLENRRDFDSFFESGEGNAFSPAERLAFEIVGVSGRAISNQFWDEAYGDHDNGWTAIGFAEGFFTGALTRCRQLRDQI